MTTTKSNRPPSQAWVRFRSVAYLTGRGLSFGVGDDLFPRVATAPGKFSLNMDILPNPYVTVCDGRTDIFADGSFDHVVVGPGLCTTPNPAAFVREITSKLKHKGHFVLYLRKNIQNNPYKLWDFNEASLIELLQGGAWRIKEQMIVGDDMLIVVKKISGPRGTLEPKRPRAAKRACIARYGALGDMVMITPLIRKLAEDGYEVTMNITPYAAPVIENNPYVSNIVIQEREAIPNADLGPYWEHWKGEYDKYINLSESIEGALLKVENRRDFFTSKTWREKTCGNINYYDQTMRLGGYDINGTRGELFFSDTERREAKKLREQYKDKFIIAWGVNGSSHHKVYPMAEAVVNEFCKTHPNVVVFLLGGPEAQRFEFEHPQVVKTAGQWPIRKTISFIALVADAAVGPESMVMNIAACYDIPKIVFMSHSNPYNLTAYWTNVTALEPDTVLAPCYPCHQLHYSLESCPIKEIRDVETDEIIASGPACAMGAIPPDVVLDALNTVVTSKDTLVAV
jgi:ADP-heptose:LPS heptosyltransferase